MRKGQYSIVYLLILIAITLVVMASVFFLSDFVRRSATKNIGTSVIENIMTHLEGGIVELKEIAATSEETNLSRTIKIPERIGEQQYLITGKDNTIELRTYGNPSLVREKEIKVWNATLFGSVFSSRGEVQLVYSPAENKIALK